MKPPAPARLQGESEQAAPTQGDDTARLLFIYWRTKPGQLPQALAAARAMQQALRDAQPGLAARLFMRADGSTPDHATVMETYALPGSGITVAFQGHIEAAGEPLTPLLLGPRHVEVFDALP